MESEYAGFIKDVNTGAILGMTKQSSLNEIETNNQQLIKRNQKHLITHIVLGKDEGIKAYNEHVAKILGTQLVGNSKKK